MDGELCPKEVDAEGMNSQLHCETLLHGGVALFPKWELLTIVSNMVLCSFIVNLAEDCPHCTIRNICVEDERQLKIRTPQDR